MTQRKKSDSREPIYKVPGEWICPVCGRETLGGDVRCSGGFFDPCHPPSVEPVWSTFERSDEDV